MGQGVDRDRDGEQHRCPPIGSCLRARASACSSPRSRAAEITTRAERPFAARLSVLLAQSASASGDLLLALGRRLVELLLLRRALHRGHRRLPASRDLSDLVEIAHAHELLVPHRRVAVLLRSEEHTSELQSRFDLVCRLLLEKKKKKLYIHFLCTNKKNRLNS